jgi:hypothetical protein
MSMPVASTWGHEFSLQACLSVEVVSGAWGGVKDGAVANFDNATAVIVLPTPAIHQR